MSPRFLNCSHCAEKHVAYGSCDLCRGRGHVLIDDGYAACPSCSLRFRREYGPFVAALRELPSDDELAREAAGDRVDWQAKA